MISTFRININNIIMISLNYSLHSPLKMQQFAVPHYPKQDLLLLNLRFIRKMEYDDFINVLKITVAHFTRIFFLGVLM